MEYFLGNVNTSFKHLNVFEWIYMAFCLVTRLPYNSMNYTKSCDLHFQQKDEIGHAIA